MEITIFTYISVATTFVYIIFKLFPSKRYRLPPSPAVALPILGHLYLLKPPLHRNLHQLSKTIGPIFSLKLGLRPAVVISSPDLTKECFTGKNDVIFANRPRVLIDKYIGYNFTTMTSGHYGDHWRLLRRIGAQELLSTTRINALLEIRKDEVKQLMLNLLKISNRGTFTKLELGPRLSELTFNVMMKMIAGKRLNTGDEHGEKIRKMISETFKVGEASNPQDFLPFLQYIDFGGYSKKLINLAEKMDKVFQELVDEQRVEKRNSMIGHLLSLQESEPNIYPDVTIKGLILSMLFAGTDTSYVTIEWAMSNLVNHPNILRKARDEIDAIVGHDRLIEEEDMRNLPYLKNIILETFRLFPAAPLLLPHLPSEDCTIGGYDIPRGTIVFINAWAIHRDPEVWDKPEVFKPERFEGGKEVEPHKLMPFGMGRRACPGIGLANRIVGLGLGSLIQCFEWERVGSELVDLAEGNGVTMPRLKPLEVMLKPREIMCKQVFEN